MCVSSKPLFGRSVAGHSSDSHTHNLMCGESEFTLRSRRPAAAPEGGLVRDRRCVFERMGRQAGGVLRWAIRVRVARRFCSEKRVERLLRSGRPSLVRCARPLGPQGGVSSPPLDISVAEAAERAKQSSTRILPLDLRLLFIKVVPNVVPRLAWASVQIESRGVALEANP